VTATATQTADMPDETTRRALLISLLTAAVMPHALPAESRQARKRRCKKIKARIARIESRLRQAHSARTGRRQRETLRELELQRYRHCR